MCYRNITIGFIDAVEAARLPNTKEEHFLHLQPSRWPAAFSAHTKSAEVIKAQCLLETHWLYLLNLLWSVSPSVPLIRFFSGADIFCQLQIFLHVSKLAAYNFFLLWTISSAEDFLLSLCLTWLCDITRHDPEDRKWVWQRSTLILNLMCPLSFQSSLHLWTLLYLWL